jgi:N-acyl-D-amino-acid deacylase
MSKYQVPGASLAITRNGSLVFAHGYGANVQPDSVFRIASLSKQLTAVAILKLAQEGKLSLDAKVADLLPNYFRNPALGIPDARFEQITVRMLMEHAGGWDNSLSLIEVNAQQLEAAAALGL